MKASTTLPLRRMRLQSGFTLVELSVATLIGLFLMGGLLTIVQDMRRTFTNQNQMSQMQDSERLAMTLVTDVIQEAGYYPDPTLENLSGAMLTTAPFTHGSGEAIAGTHNGAAPGDTISVQFKTAPNDGVINCRGTSNTSGANQVFVSTFSVDALGNLNCTLSGTLGANAPVALVTGVKNLQVLYGVKTNFALANDNADTYLNASQMSAGNWLSIICVKVTITFDNSVLAASQPGQPATIPFTRVITVMMNGGVNTA
jgi:type IV pilus assembly protein PilW